MKYKINIYIFLTALFIGFLIVTQSHSFQEASDLLSRDMQSNIFQEIKILNDKNLELKEERNNLQETLDQIIDRESALSAIENEIEKYKKLTGNNLVSGPGLTLTINENLSIPWIIDIINELFNAGANAISINNIRIVNKTAGFDRLPNGQILFYGTILTPPFVFEVIGDPLTLYDILNLSGGILERALSSIPNLTINIERQEFIKIR